MKTIWIVGLLLLSVACMRKSADGTYHVPAKMDESTKTDLKKSGNELKAEAKKIGAEIKQDTKKAAAKTGDALEHAGQKLKNESQKRH